MVLFTKRKNKMKAAVLQNYGKLDQLTLTEIEKPEPAANQIQVRVKAAGLNPVDKKLREGDLKDLIPITFPRVLAGDVSGVVTAHGEDVSDFAIGDEVYFATPLDANGGNAEYTVVDAAIAAHKPVSLSHAEAATLPVVALTAVQALRDFAGLKKGDNVLIHAGAGGVGVFAIQYAKHLGATVYTTASAKNHDFLKELGADHVIDYREEDFVDVARKIDGFDVVFETVGHENYLRSIEAAKDGVAIPSIVNPPSESDLELAAKKRIKTDFMLLEGNRQDLELIAKLIDDGIAKTRVGKSFPLDQAPMAHELLASGINHGKIVVEV